MIIPSGYTAPLLKGVLWVPRNPLNFGNHYHWMSGMVWYGTQETHTPKFLKRDLYMTFYFISFIWRSCLKILFEDLVWRSCLKILKVWNTASHLKVLNALWLKNYWIEPAAIIWTLKWGIVMILYREEFKKQRVQIAKKNLQIIVQNKFYKFIWWFHCLKPSFRKQP